MAGRAAGRALACRDLLREQRGDAHVAVLTAEGVSGRESNVLHAAAGQVPREYMARARDYDDEAWRQHETAGRARTAQRPRNVRPPPGSSSRTASKRQPTRLALSALDALSDDEVEELFAALTPITRQVIAGGDIPSLVRRWD